MTILKKLDDLKTGFPGAEVAAYLDLAAQTVLGKSSALVQPQERLDALCAEANALLDGPEGDLDEAIRVTPRSVTVVLRAPEDRGEALCLVASPDADVDAARAALQAALGPD